MEATDLPINPVEWPILNDHERRVLGVLVEKAKTTPDTYPMSVNALVAGCNQKSNREPVLSLNDAEVEDTLAGLQQKGLAIKITGGRVVRWRHNLYEAWRLGKADLAIIGELLLRGAQTEGELRARASRMEPIADLDSLRAILRPLAERKLVVYLTAEGRRGTMLTHGFLSPAELVRLPQGHSEEVMGTERQPRPSTRESSTETLRAELAEMRSQIQELEERVARLEAERLAGDGVPAAGPSSPT